MFKFHGNFSPSGKRVSRVPSQFVISNHVSLPFPLEFIVWMMLVNIIPHDDQIRIPIRELWQTIVKPSDKPGGWTNHSLKAPKLSSESFTHKSHVTSNLKKKLFYLAFWGEKLVQLADRVRRGVVTMDRIKRTAG